MNTRAQSRSAARLAAVQALYQHEMEGTPVAKLIHEFHQHRIGATIEDEEYADADTAFFDDIVKGTLARAEEIDGAIVARLASRWSMARLDRTLKSSVESRGGVECVRACRSRWQRHHNNNNRHVTTSVQQRPIH